MVNEQTLCKNGRQAILALAQNVVGADKAVAMNTERDLRLAAAGAKRKRKTTLAVISPSEVAVSETDATGNATSQALRSSTEIVDGGTSKEQQFFLFLVQELNKFAPDGVTFDPNNVFYVFDIGNFFKTRSMEERDFNEFDRQSFFKFLLDFEKYFSLATTMEKSINNISNQEPINELFPIQNADDAVTYFKELKAEQFSSVLRKLLEFLKDDIILEKEDLKKIYKFLELKLIVKERGLLIEFFENLLWKTLNYYGSNQDSYTNEIRTTQELYYSFIQKLYQSPYLDIPESFGENVIKRVIELYDYFLDSQVFTDKIKEFLQKKKDVFVKEIKELVSQYGAELTPAQQTELLGATNVLSTTSNESEEVKQAEEYVKNFNMEEVADDQAICLKSSRKVRKLLEDYKIEVLKLRSENQVFKDAQSTQMVQSGKDVVELQGTIQRLKQNNETLTQTLTERMEQLAVVEAEKEKFKKLFTYSTGLLRQLKQNSIDLKADLTMD
jgi:hypothetical protein